MTPKNFIVVLAARFQLKWESLSELTELKRAILKLFSQKGSPLIESRSYAQLRLSCLLKFGAYTVGVQKHMYTYVWNVHICKYVSNLCERNFEIVKMYKK